ncbi:MAG TPA: hypothetical protein VJA26_13835 [Gammaproteobacteria bacterium]|nr:hypothetical protein [Gammaproteobacteria bacterium]
MGTRTVRLDEEAEQELARLRKLTGLSISEVLKRGLLVYRAQVFKETTERPYAVYSRLDLGDGGYARGSATEAKSAVVNLIKRKHGR